MPKAVRSLPLALVSVLAAPSLLAGPPGDCDNNGVVDAADVAAWYACFQGPLSPPGPGCECADLNGDGVVDMRDLALLQQLVLAGAPVQEAELAGLATTIYPYFEHVNAFNVGSPVQMAIDPFLMPGLVGKNVHIYVVADKSAAQWGSDPALVDVRGAPQSFTFSGASIQANTVTLSLGTLSANGGIALGLGYDVVIDVNKDGVLNGGDVIDGLSNGIGLHVLPDLTLDGPLATSSATYSGGTFLGQVTVWPTNLAALGPRPLVVISHGNGHQYTWYNYLQQSLASYGYIVMSHQNNTVPGIESASTTTLTNTDYLLANQATIAGGALNGLIDSSRIIWIGHSRGGEGVVRAYDRIFDGAWAPQNYTLDDIVLISSIAPTDFLGTASSNPHDVNYHMLYGSADGDVCGCPNNDVPQSFHLLDRATGTRQATYVHGADHNDFNCCGVNDFTGPAGTEIGRPEAQRVAKAVYLALIKHYVEGHQAAGEVLWRQYERFKPIGVAGATTVVSQFKPNPTTSASFVIDDFQVNGSPNFSSSGGAVSYNVLNLTEGLLDDNNTSFEWLVSDPMNGMTYARTTDYSRGVVFDWTLGTDRFIEWAIIPAGRDFTPYRHLSFRACQGTRHPETVAVLGDLVFTVTLRDASGTTSSMRIDAFGGGIEEPYQRTGYGVGAGWQNEFETIRLPLQAFRFNGSGLDLTNVVAVRFEFGTSYGAGRGRLGLDDLELTRE